MFFFVFLFFFFLDKSPCYCLKHKADGKGLIMNKGGRGGGGESISHAELGGGGEHKRFGVALIWVLEVFVFYP